MAETMQDPNGWAWGPPKSDAESWRCHRKDELFGTATTIFLGRMRIRAASDGEDWKNDAEERERIENEEVETAVRLALKLRDRCEAEIPRA